MIILVLAGDSEMAGDSEKLGFAVHLALCQRLFYSGNRAVAGFCL